MLSCNLCPRECDASRDGNNIGICGEKNEIRVSRIAPHHFEEPPISGTNGSGTVFFSGCSLHCVYCQNRDISRVGGKGHTITADALYREILTLAESGVHNINLVTAAHFVHLLVPVLERLRASGDLKIPVVYNSSGYEKLETVKRLDGLVDIYLPDFKYASSELAAKYSHAPDYPSVAETAIREMYRQVGKYMYDQSTPALLANGLVVRHLVLPSHRADSIAVLRRLCEILPTDGFLLSLMSQYTPDFALDTPYKNLHRRVTTFEYMSVADEALRLGLNGFMQSKASASSDFTPNF